MVLTLDEAKALIGTSANGKDDTINILIPIVDGFIKDKTHNPFLDPIGEDLYPAGVKLAASQIIKFFISQGDNSKSSESIGSMSIAHLNDIPPVILSLLKPYNRILAV